MKKLLITMVGMTTLLSCGQEELSDLEFYGLTGDVKSVTTISYEAFDKFGEGNLQKLKPSDAIVQMTEFDSVGNVVTDKFLMVTDAKRTYTTVLNDNHQWTKWMSYEDDDDTKMQYGTNYYYDEKGNLVKELDLRTDEVENYQNTFDGKGNIISQIGGSYKRYWEYDNGVLTKFTEKFAGMTTELYYKDGVVVRDVCGPEAYWLYTHDEYKRTIESTMYRNDNVNIKKKNFYADDNGVAPIKEIIWNADGEVEHDYQYAYFLNGNDTVTVAKYDKGELIEIEFYAKDSKGVTKDTYKTKSSLLFGFQYNYADNSLMSLRDLKLNKDFKYENGVATIIEGSDETTETKYRRNRQISRITKDSSGKIVFSYIVDESGSTHKTTVTDNGETKITEEKLEKGKIIEEKDMTTGVVRNFSYNDHGFISEIKSSDGTVLSYEYVFDTRGNWTRWIEYKNGKAQKINERSIIYN